MIGIGLNLLSQIITRSWYGYRFKSGPTISHLLYVNDIKLYVTSEQDIDSWIHINIQWGHQDVIWTRDVWLDGGWVIKIDRVELAAGHIAEIQTNYKYLGIPLSHGNYEKEARKTAISVYHQKIMRRQLNGKKKIYANNMYALPVMIPCQYTELAKEGYRSCWCENP